MSTRDPDLPPPGSGTGVHRKGGGASPTPNRPPDDHKLRGGGGGADHLDAHRNEFGKQGISPRLAPDWRGRATYYLARRTNTKRGAVESHLSRYPKGGWGWGWAGGGWG